jgi:hypothetical protein
MRVIALLLIISLFLFFSCGPSPKEIKLVAIGDSITMGIQDGGLVKDNQYNSFPFLIAKQMGITGDFQQPLVSSPGYRGQYARCAGEGMKRHTIRALSGVKDLYR